MRVGASSPLRLSRLRDAEGKGDGERGELGLQGLLGCCAGLEVGGGVQCSRLIDGYKPRKGKQARRRYPRGQVCE